MFRKLFILILITGAVQINAQDQGFIRMSLVDSVRSAGAYYEQDLNPSPLHFSTTLGTSFSYMGRFGSAMNYFAAPHINYSASKRLSFHGGLIASYTVFPGSFISEGNKQAAAYPSVSLFVASSYRLTENLYIHGTGIKSMPSLFGSMNPAALDFQDISIGATYDFGSFSIGASFHRSSGYSTSPFGGFQPGMYGSPLFY